ncbi:putative mediator of RNA polymerase II transcription subunit 21 [Chrysoperla carnea]|uniref:putative mediator of RNA polymerase II transcription subunit 21 n=1 Tax=Chrysoperla carnea TaxID=189513 RepID=UPI001D092830|nr:putative mediator of RNA polymerase II transcription subunit 21 [Chrysoperla carnea]
MKVILGLFALELIIVMTSAEAPRQFFNNQRFNQRQNFGFQRQEQQPNEAPYAPSGWRPQGAAFTLPARQQQQQPEDQYGPPPPPDNQYGPPAAQPDNQYGPPPQQPNQVDPRQARTTTDSNEELTTLEPQAENIKSEKLKNAKQVESVFKNTDRGFYYVYLPDGRLQRVVYTTSADLQNMAYTARVRYEDVDPVSAPIYSAAAVNGAPVAPLVAAPQRLIVQ